MLLHAFVMRANTLIHMMTYYPIQDEGDYTQFHIIWLRVRVETIHTPTEGTTSG